MALGSVNPHIIAGGFRLGNPFCLLLTLFVQGGHNMNTLIWFAGSLLVLLSLATIVGVVNAACSRY